MLVKLNHTSHWLLGATAGLFQDSVPEAQSQLCKLPHLNVEVCNVSVVQGAISIEICIADNIHRSIRWVFSLP